MNGTNQTGIPQEEIQDGSAEAASPSAPRSNSIFVIHPHQDGGALVFDDPAVGLRKEPFVMGADTVLRIAALMVAADPDRFTLLFSGIPFPGHQASAEWLEPGEAGIGDWYRVTLPENGSHDAWLCPALLKYFPAAPARIYFAAKPIERISA